MKPIHIFVALAAVLAASPVIPGEACMRFNAEDEIAEGRLAIGGFQDAAGRPESAYILSLPEPTCLDADDPEYRVDSADTIQIYSSDDAVHAQIEAFVGMTVLVRGSPFGAHTAHHHAPIIMDISEIDTQ